MMAQQQHIGFAHLSLSHALAIVTVEGGPVDSQPERSPSPMSRSLEFTSILPANDGDRCAALMDSLEREFSDWFDEFAPVDVDLSDWGGLAVLSKSAPHPFLAGLAAGKLAERIALSVVTGRRPADYDHSFLPEFPMTDLATELEAANPAWFDVCSQLESDPTASIEQIKELVNTAPHPYFAGCLYGHFTACLEFRAITGR